MKQSAFRARFRTPFRMAALALVLVALPALAAAPQDPPKPAEGEKPAEAPKPAEPAKAAGEPAKKERKVDPKAQALIDAYGKAIHTPKSAGVKQFTMSAEADLGLGPDPIGMNGKWSGDGGLVVDLVIPKSLSDNMPPEILDMARGLAKDMLVDKLVRPLIDGALFEAPSYDLAWEETKDGQQVVKMSPFATKTTWDRLAVTFGKDGLLAGMAGVPNVDPNDPVAGMYAGVEVEFKLTHAKIGEKHVLESVNVNTPLGEITATAAYFDGPSGLPLLRSLATADATGQTRSTRFFDYVVDGKPVAGTEKNKPAAKADAVTPAEPAKEAKPETPPDNK